MASNRLTKDIMKCEVLKIKRELDHHHVNHGDDPKDIAHKYLNKILDKLDEFRM